MDIVDKATRSRMMSRIRGRDTKPEVDLRKALHSLGYRYRVHVGQLPGRPDIVLARHKAVVLVHGCFWHRHPGCPLATTPASNQAFWETKFSGTVKRDARVASELRDLGWRVATVWECSLDRKHILGTVNRLARWLASTKREIEI